MSSKNYINVDNCINKFILKNGVNSVAYTICIYIYVIKFILPRIMLLHRQGMHINHFLSLFCSVWK